MHFERSLKRSTYGPWKDKYIDYQKLKQLLRDDGSDAGSAAGAADEDEEWTEKDEEAFVEELINNQLEKVHHFQSETVQDLRERTSACEAQLDPVVVKGKEQQDEKTTEKAVEEVELDESGKNTLRETLKKLDSITHEMNELEKYSRINYTGFLKAAKKHDRRRGHAYRVMPIMRVRLSELPFNKEDYSPLLFRLSTMYSFCRDRLESRDKSRTFSDHSIATDSFRSYKFWVHQDNLLELKTVILRRLPVLIYNPQTSKVAEGGQKDPTMTSIYFDNPNFSLYNAKVGQDWPATSLRVRWYDDLAVTKEIYCEKKTVFEDDTSKEQKFTTKPKHIRGFLRGDNKLEKEVQRLKDRVGEDSDQVPKLQESINDIQSFVKDNNLQPVVRANYTRTAFQMPGDNRVRITLDTNLALIREDSLDEERPCRNPDDWHRTDIDDSEMEYPFDTIRKGEINRFSYALLEIRLRGDRNFEWISEVMNSHLVTNAPRFSKFVHGVAQLFDDYVNTFPFWLSEVDTDIRRDPHQAFEDEQQRKAKAAEDEFAVGSLLNSASKSVPGGLKQDIKSPVGSPSSPKQHSRTFLNRRVSAHSTRISENKIDPQHESTVDEEDSDNDDITQPAVTTHDSTGLRSFLPSFSMSKYAQFRRRKGQGDSPVSQPLPPGVVEPSYWIKDEGPVKVEAKVWLANQRTFIKWQHVGILLASLSLGLFNAAGENNKVAQTLGVIYTVVALFIALWGWGIYMYRARLIERRSGKDFDNIIGPCIVCLALIVALALNFGFKYNAVLERRQQRQNPNSFGNTGILLDDL